MRTIETKAYLFSELSEDAKTKAIEKTRCSDSYLDCEWHEFVIEDFKEKAKKTGFEVDGVYFSGFWSQGDGAMFEYSDIDNKLVKSFLLQLDIDLYTKAKRIEPNLSVYGKGRHYGFYYHEKTCKHSVELECFNLGTQQRLNDLLQDLQFEIEEYIEDIYSGLCNDLYSTLEKEYDYLNSDPIIAEHLEFNEYEFDEQGNFI